MTRTGFLLFEFLISLILGGLIILASLHFMWVALGNSYRVMGQCSHFCEILCVSSLVERLLGEAPAHREHWKKTERDELVWSNERGDSGLSVNKEELVFITGTYDSKQQRWLSQTNKSVLLRGVKEIAFNYGIQQPMVISYTLVTTTDSLENSICCLGGPIMVFSKE